MSGFSAVTYALAKKYTDETASQFGGLKGAPCTVSSVVKQDGKTIITLSWENNEGETRQTTFSVSDGTPIYTWESNFHYKYGDLVIYQSSFYRCAVENEDSNFDPTKWNEIGNPDGDYDIVNSASDLPQRFTAVDRKLYYCIEDNIFYLWNGEAWEEQHFNPDTISDDDIDALF